MKLPPKEQIPKITLGANLSGIKNCSVTHLWRARMNDLRHQRGRLRMYNEA